ncbi:peptidase M22, glycoprotease [Calocera viscosa TUFC12733]|uniref:N(6)-L-threonylcarbamoyladenine synthase n=1 Tax=Calocera viscosa (strain TUFC12733) TaxID=1330018 RepID=A0A167RLQ5_CALVF|nr:peptidase M22, glycoprotease [Calocera viscosa TUFC12733]
MSSASSLRCLSHSRLHRPARLLRTRPFAVIAPAQKPFTVLALESSADDTCAAVVSSDRVMHSNIVLKQNDVHKKYNGIHPPSAIYAHTERMPSAVQQALLHARMSMEDIDGIAFTQGPGMGGCLAVACNAAQTLAAALGKPLVGVNHMRAHALTITLTEPDPPPFPHLTLLVSGGHTMLVLVNSEEEYQMIATTADEALGETFDRVAAMLGLEWGERGLGAALEECASSHSDTDADDYDIKMPTMLPGQDGFSFCGLRGHTKRVIQTLTKREGGQLFQAAAVVQLTDKLARAIKTCRRSAFWPKAIVVSGGVASNMYLRSRLHFASAAAHAGEGEPAPVYYPPPNLCTDNAVMIAWASMHRFLAGDTDPYGLRPLPGWKIDLQRSAQEVVGQ